MPLNSMTLEMLLMILCDDKVVELLAGPRESLGNSYLLVCGTKRVAYLST